MTREFCCNCHLRRRVHLELKTLTIQTYAVFQVVDFRLARNLLAFDRYRSMVVDLLDPEET